MAKYKTNKPNKAHVQANAAFACWQYPTFFLLEVTEHDLVMYHGGPS